MGNPIHYSDPILNLSTLLVHYHLFEVVKLHENRQSDTSFSVLTTNNRVTNRVFEYLSSNQKKIKLIKNVREETNSLKAKKRRRCPPALLLLPEKKTEITPLLDPLLLLLFVFIPSWNCYYSDIIPIPFLIEKLKKKNSNSLLPIFDWKENDGIVLKPATLQSPLTLYWRKLLRLKKASSNVKKQQLKT